ncbi:ABC transporter substrate-binding protein [Pseudonocardia endophytica]|uniref:Iron complex transport system substrate-binding protein n=1 Tax=Pseudonocardia endophytica TaxID=401976 RepID=A0A4V2PIQ1_PSEEN|nr:ABC transporter substrate-binding protein [Pseudonocardia endophytica]TCK25546.1 iron complex transport system substrate-binding protein [Pseudonocardia endophytica]
MTVGGRRMRWTAAVFAMVTVLVAGCGGQASGPGAQDQGTRTVQTERGPVEVPSDPQRVVVLSGGLAGYFYTLDVPVVASDTRVLGVTNFDGGFPPSWADAAREVGTTPLPSGEQLSVEAVAAARPDLIVGGGQGITAVQASESYDKLAAIAPTVLVPRTVIAWQDQLAAVADAVNRSDRVAELQQRYQDRVTEVQGAITPPQGEVVYIASLPGDRVYLVPAKAALPALGRGVGLQPSDVVAKAPGARLASTGDSLQISPELLGRTADSPNAIVVDLGGPPLADLAKNPIYAALPSFRANRVWELPATSYRPDYDGALDTLDRLQTTFRKAG